MKKVVVRVRKSSTECYLGGLPQKLSNASLCLHADNTNIIIKGNWTLSSIGIG